MTDLSSVPPFTIFYGGRRVGLVPPTLDELDHAAWVDAILVRILGGVPNGRRSRS